MTDVPEVPDVSDVSEVNAKTPSQSPPDEAPSEIVVTVIGGYLGAGKTTLVNHILRNADERVAVLVNDFGDINIDADLIESEEDDTISLANGCICCSLVDGFAAALTTVRDLQPVPQRLVIEASGVADPATVAAYGHGPGLVLDAVVVVVDAETVQQRARDKYVGDTVTAQLRSADIVVLNKTDLVSDGDLATTTEWVRNQVPTAVLFTARNAVVDPVLLFGATDGYRLRSEPAGAGSADDDGHDHDEPHDHAEGHDPAPADQLFDSWTWAGVEPLDRAAVEAFMEALPETVVRAKGLLAITEEPDRSMILQRVGRRWTLRRGGAREDGTPSQLVVIGYRGTIDEQWLERQLRS